MRAVIEVLGRPLVGCILRFFQKVARSSGWSIKPAFQSTTSRGYPVRKVALRRQGHLYRFQNRR
jgi:hypothetical protein